MFPCSTRVLFSALCLWLALVGAQGVETLRVGGPARTVDLRPWLGSAGTVVRVDVRLGTETKPVNILLFDETKPITVTNFLRYVNAGRYAGSFFHRSVPGFVVQGGGFFWDNTDKVVSVASFGAIQNEPGISNLRGTVAMAKLGGDPNSATNQWFVNLANNAANLDAQNGGFTVFGRVIGTGMDVMDEVAALPRYNAGSPFDSLPLKDFPGGTITRVYTVEMNATALPGHSAVPGDPELVTAALTGPMMRLDAAGSRTGTTAVAISATNTEGVFTQGSVDVEVLARSAGWRAEGAATFSYDPADKTGLAGDGAPAAWGTVTLTASEGRTFTLRNDGGTTLTGLSLVKHGANPADFVVTSGLGTTTLAAGASTSFTVAFAPSAAGSRSATLRVGSADVDAASFTLALSGTGHAVEAPVLSGVAQQSVEADATGMAVVPEWRGTTVTASDSLEIVTFTQTPAPGSVLALGRYPLVFRAVNSAGIETRAETTLDVRFSRPSTPRIAPASGAYGGAPVAGEGLPAGSVLSGFGTPAISDLRDMAARATITSGRVKTAAIYMEDGAGQSRVVARQGGASGVSGATFKSFKDPVLSPSGKIAFCAKLAGPARGGDEGLWSDLFGNLEPLLREGVAVPGLIFRLKSVTSATLTGDALLALVKLAPLPGVVAAGVSDTALVRVTGIAASTVLSRTGIGFEGSTIKRISVLQPAARSAGQGRWESAGKTLAKLTLADKRTVLVSIAADGTVTHLVQAGAADAAFSAPLTALGLPSAGGSGVAVLATKARVPGVSAVNDSALLFAPTATPFSTAVAEDAAAETARFSALSDPVANDRGSILFFSTLRGGMNPALFQTDGASEPEVVARQGSTAVDADGHSIPGVMWKNITSFALPDGAGAGAIFIAELSGSAVNSSNKLGLCAVDSTGLPRLLLRTGASVSLPNGTKTVKSFTALNALPGSFGARRSYNATGSVAVQATFTDKSQSLIRLDIP